MLLPMLVMKIYAAQDDQRALIWFQRPAGAGNGGRMMISKRRNVLHL